MQLVHIMKKALITASVRSPLAHSVQCYKAPVSFFHQNTLFDGRANKIIKRKRICCRVCRNIILITYRAERSGTHVTAREESFAQCKPENVCFITKTSRHTLKRRNCRSIGKRNSSFKSLPPTKSAATEMHSTAHGYQARTYTLAVDKSTRRLL